MNLGFKVYYIIIENISKIILISYLFRNLIKFFVLFFDFC